jgi:succinoglycan biosynthesis protein ExoA
MREAPEVTVVVPARDEREALPALIDAIERQTQQPVAVIVADGMSRDGTRAWLEQAQGSRPWLRVLDNPERQISTGLNRAIAAARSPVVVRMDAHATYAPDYLERVCRVFAERPEVVAVGGAMRSVGRGAWGRAIASVLRRPFALGGARHRVGGAGGPVDHVFSPAYRRQAVLDAGGFDPALLANEDFELDCRLRKRGGVVWLEDSAACRWQVRESPRALARQMWRYGFYKSRTLRRHPDSLRLRQLAPPALVTGLAVTAVLDRRRAAAAAGAYLLTAGGLGARAAQADGTSAWRAATAVPVVHLSWGSGLLAGLLSAAVRPVTPGVVSAAAGTGTGSSCARTSSSSA